MPISVNDLSIPLRAGLSLYGNFIEIFRLEKIIFGRHILFVRLRNKILNESSRRSETSLEFGSRFPRPVPYPDITNREHTFKPYESYGTVVVTASWTNIMISSLDIRIIRGCTSRWNQPALNPLLTGSVVCSQS